MALLLLEGIDVRFGGVHALRGVTLDVQGSLVTGLIGPNGAGKTTLFNVASGLLQAERGRVVLDGRDVTRLRPHRRARLGLARTFQRLEAFGSLTVRENVLVAAEISRLTSRATSRSRSHGTADSRSNRTVDELLDLVGLRNVADRRVDAVPTGTARLVELARALATRPKVLLLDEPSSGLDDRETDELARVLARLAGEGLGMLLVEHDVDLVMRVCEVIHVLDFGRQIARGTPAQIRKDPAVRDAYLGTLEEDDDDVA